MSCIASGLSGQVAQRAGIGDKSLADKMLKLNHLGEFIAVNIYCAQLSVCRRTAAHLVPVLEEFLTHEKRHMHIFSAELVDRGVARCRAFTLLGFAGFLLGLFTALLGKTGVMACTAAVETVVLNHLQHQLEHLRSVHDTRAVNAIEAIMQDEIEHRDRSDANGGSPLYSCVYAIVAPPTSWIIKLGMYL
jgi:ubiquinone biosynthesis monooxygenase Coq7